MSKTDDRWILRATTRLVTGGSYNTAYVFNRTTGKAIEGCRHHHRSHVTAQKCANKMLRKYRRTL